MKKGIKSIVHACFGTSSLQTTRDFYCKVLDGEVVHEFHNAEHELYGMIVKIGDKSFLEFFLDKTPFVSQQMFRHLCFEVEDIQSTKKRLEAHGFVCEINCGKTDFTLQLWINDPQGIKLEFHQYDEKSLLTQYLDK